MTCVNVIVLQRKCQQFQRGLPKKRNPRNPDTVTTSTV